MVTLRNRFLDACLTVFLLAGTCNCNQTSADTVRSAEWPLSAFHAQDRIWPHSAGMGVTVAVIDSGARATHQDLTGQIIPGEDLIGGKRNPVTRDYDPHGHGTEIASIVSGHGHGQGGTQGIEGLAPKAKVMPLAVDVMSGNQQLASAALRYAVDHGAQVINMSFGFPNRSDTLQSAISYAESQNRVLVASSGNSGSNTQSWPAAYPGVVAVGAVDVNGKPWVDSNYGPGLTLTAPGVNIVAAGANSDSEYRVSDGTSDAAAYVSAEAALVRAEYPGLTAGQVVNRMVKSAVNPTGRVHDDHYGYGIIRPDAALTFDIPPGPPEGPLAPAGVAASGQATPAAAVAVKAGGTGRNRGGSGVAVAGAVGAGVVAGVGGVWWVWRRRRKGVG